MGYKNLYLNAVSKRGSSRKKRHGNWRQTFIDCGGMCVFKENGDICGETEELEFHEQFGEDHNGDGKMQQRILLCKYHHDIVTDKLWKNRHQNMPTKLQLDVCVEMHLCGGYAGWIKRYKLNDTWGRLIPV